MHCNTRKIGCLKNLHKTFKLSTSRKVKGRPGRPKTQAEMTAMQRLFSHFKPILLLFIIFYGPLGCTYATELLPGDSLLFKPLLDCPHSTKQHLAAGFILASNIVGRLIKVEDIIQNRRIYNVKQAIYNAALGPLVLGCHACSKLINYRSFTAASPQLPDSRSFL